MSVLHRFWFISLLWAIFAAFFAGLVIFLLNVSHCEFSLSRCGYFGITLKYSWAWFQDGGQFVCNSLPGLCFMIGRRVWGSAPSEANSSSRLKTNPSDHSTPGLRLGRWKQTLGEARGSPPRGRPLLCGDALKHVLSQGSPGSPSRLPGRPRRQVCRWPDENPMFYLFYLCCCFMQRVNLAPGSPRWVETVIVVPYLRWNLKKNS